MEPDSPPTTATTTTDPAPPPPPPPPPAAKKGGAGGGGGFALLLLGGFVAVTLAVVLGANSHTSGLDLPPPRVQAWMEIGQRLPLRLAAGDATVFAVVLGTKQRSETVVLLPDWLGGSFAFRDVATRLEAAGFRVITADLPGRGLSRSADAPADVPVDVPDVLDSLVRTTGVRAAHFVLAGEAFAAAIPWIVAHRGKVRSVVLAGVAGHGGAALHLPAALQHVPPSAWGWWPLQALTIQWLRAHAAHSFDESLLHDYIFLAGAGAGAGAGVDVDAPELAARVTAFAQLQVPTLRLYVADGAVRGASGAGSASHAVGPALPHEAHPAATALLIANFVNAQEKTPAAPVEEIPAHVLAQLQAGAHGHGHHHHHHHHGSCNH